MRHTSFQAISPAGLAIKAVTTEADRLLAVVRPIALDARALTVARDRRRFIAARNGACWVFPRAGVPYICACRSVGSGAAMPPVRGGFSASRSATALPPFGRGIAADLAAAKVALIEPWSNGQTEGQITKLKPVKRQMYGHAGIDLLRARLVVAP